MKMNHDRPRAELASSKFQRFNINFYTFFAQIMASKLHKYVVQKENLVPVHSFLHVSYCDKTSFRT